MEEAEVLSYVKAAAQAVGLPLDEARAQAVALHLGRTAAMARALEQVALVPGEEIAEIYCPADFPGEDAS